MTDKKIKKGSKIDESKLEGLKVIGGKDGYIPDTEADKKVYTSPVKIGDKEYIIKPLSMLDIKKLNVERGKVKDGDLTANFDLSFKVLLTVIQKFNPETKDLTVEQFEDMVNIVEFEKVQAAILQISGLKKYFKPGDSKK